MNQPTSAPTTKVAAAGVSAAVTVIVVWVAGLFGLEIPGEVAGAIAALFAFAGGYLIPESAPADTYVGEHRSPDSEA